MADEHVMMNGEKQMIVALDWQAASWECPECVSDSLTWHSYEKDWYSHAESLADNLAG